MSGRKPKEAWVGWTWGWEEYIKLHVLRNGVNEVLYTHGKRS